MKNQGYSESAANRGLNQSIKLRANRQMIIFVLFFISVFQLQSTPMIRLKMMGLVNSLDETVVYYQVGATPGFDASYDAYFLAGPNAAPHIAQQYNSVLMAVNGINPVSQIFTISIKATTPVSGNFTITAEDFEELPKGTCAYIKDLNTGISHNILAGPYSFYLQNTNTGNRFILMITKYIMPFSANLTQPSCLLINNGSIKINSVIDEICNYTWKDASGSVVRSVSNISGSDSLHQLSGGSYTVEMLSVSGCFSKDTAFTILPVNIPQASFSAPDTIVMGLQKFEPTNQSSACVSIAWDFGDNLGISNKFDPSYNYSMPGLYKVRLSGLSSTGCADTVNQYVTVIALTTHLKNEMNQSLSFANLGNKQYKIQCDAGFNSTCSINLQSQDGKLIMQHQAAFNNNRDLLFDLNTFEDGVYLLTIIDQDRTILSRKLLLK